MTEILLHDSATRRKQPLVPLEAGHVRMYVCGPTVYDLAHLGNARPVVVFDVLARLLRRHFPRVTYVRNITDVDDKINARARETGEPIEIITARTTEAFHADMAALNCLPPDVEPRATRHIAEMIALIERLLASGHAYVAQGHVLFRVASFPAYGRLSGRSREELLAGARVEVAPYKQDPGDFVLWKPSDADTPGWDSPWGRGRPGWHIECSAMSWRYLGEEFDIHGGGHDLIFPHHENEIAQSCCAFGRPRMAALWVHNGMLLVNGEKMSKSLGNFLTVRDILARSPWAGRPSACCSCARITAPPSISPSPGWRKRKPNWMRITPCWSAPHRRPMRNPPPSQSWRNGRWRRCATISTPRLPWRGCGICARWRMRGRWAVPPRWCCSASGGRRPRPRARRRQPSAGLPPCSGCARPIPPLGGTAKQRRRSRR